MKFTVTREALLEPLQLVAGVVERRQTLPILSNLLMDVAGDRLSVVGTDQEVELCARANTSATGAEGRTTVPARKLLDIFRSLPDKSEVDLALEGGRLGIHCARFNSQLATLPADDFPVVEMEEASASLTLPGKTAAHLLDQCSFAMAQQDVRYFFNGMLFEITPDRLRTVATNGQRLATCFVDGDMGVSAPLQVIIPRKGIIELARLLPASDEPVTLRFSRNHMQADSERATLTTKLVDATYPDYGRAIPTPGDKTLTGNRREIREALSRTAILSNEMHHNIRLQLSAGTLQMQANNPLQEEARESVAVDYTGDELEIGFNVGYLIDALGAMAGETVTMCFSDAASAMLLTDPDDEASRFVVSPMIL